MTVTGRKNEQLKFYNIYEYNLQDCFSRPVSHPNSDSEQSNDDKQDKLHKIEFLDLDFSTNNKEQIYIHQKQQYNNEISHHFDSDNLLDPQNALYHPPSIHYPDQSMQDQLNTIYSILAGNKEVNLNKTSNKPEQPKRQQYKSKNIISKVKTEEQLKNNDQSYQESELVDQTINTPNGQKRIDRCAWTAEENRQFLKAMELFGRKKQTRISEFVGTRTVNQVISHSQKFFQKVRKRLEKRTIITIDLYTTVSIKFVLPATVLFLHQQLPLQELDFATQDNIKIKQFTPTNYDEKILLFNKQSHNQQEVNIKQEQNEAEISDKLDSSLNKYINLQNTAVNNEIVNFYDCSGQISISAKRHALKQAQQRLEMLQGLQEEEQQQYITDQLAGRLKLNQIYEQYTDIVYRVASIVDICQYQQIIINVILEHLFEKDSTLPEQIVRCI